MSGLLRRIQRSRPVGAGESVEGDSVATTPEATPRPAEPVVPGPAGPEEEDPRAVAGLDPLQPSGPSVFRRGPLRRRLRYLRRARELMLRDLGGLLYEVHRTGGGRVDPHAPLLGAKVERLAALDAEAHALEQVLAAPRGAVVSFEPGVGGACPTCGEYHAAEARFCSHCGSALEPATEATATAAPDPAPETQLALPAPDPRGNQLLGLAAAPHEQPTEIAAESPTRALPVQDGPPAPPTGPQSPVAPEPGR